jgi:hypothetical protein
MGSPSTALPILPKAPVHDPIVDKDGNLTPQWQIYYQLLNSQTVTQSVGGQYSSSDGSLTGSINGANTVFTMPAALSAFSLFRNGLLMTRNLDYTVAGNVITLVAAQTPQPGDVLTVIT